MKKRTTVRVQDVRAIVPVLCAVLLLGGCYETTYDKAVAALNACGTTTPPPPPPPPPTGSFGPNFSEIQAGVFTPDCATSGCHSGSSPAASLNLEAANSYTMLVGVASTQSAGTQRVSPTNPNTSYLIQKLEGSGVTGSQMPPGSPLAQSDIDVIRQWITAGAADDRAVASSPIRVTSLSVAPGSTLAAAPSQIIAGFDREPDASTVNVNTFILEASNNDGTFGDGDDLMITAASISVPGANPQSAVFDLTGVTLADDSYRVRLLGSGASLIMDLDANALDGEFSGTFPSGNATAGGDFSAQFTIMTPVVLGPTLDEIQTAVFTPSCATSTCHSNTAQAAGLALGDADTSFLELVGQFSNQNGQSAVMLVAPNDPDNSYLIRKLENTAGITGARMPLNAAPLPQPDIDVIRQWISAGAVR